MIIGKFQQEDGVYVGSIVGFAAVTPVRIAPTELKGIDYTVTIAGEGLELGIAWKKVSAKGNDYVSVKLDAPYLPAPVNCALFQHRDGSYDLVWDREKPKAEQAAA
jgi:uncharacterized protein (DUF736 family)